MTASGGAPGGGEYSLGTAVLRLYGDRSALDKELEVLRRYTERLEKQGVTVKFDGNTGALTREVDGLQRMLGKAKEAMQAITQGMQGDGTAFKGLGESLSKLGGQSRAGAAAAGALGGVAKAAGVAIPLLGQVGLAVMGLEGIFKGATAAINAFLGPLKQLSAEAARFNQQVAQGGIFTANSFGIFGPDGKLVEGTANQMRAVRGVITKEYGEIQKEVAKISGATASEIYEGFNIILQNIDALGDKGTDLANVTKLSTRIAAGMNTLGIPGQQLRSEVNSLLTGDIQMYDQLAQKLGITRDVAQQQQAAGTYYDFLIEKLNKLYDGQKVLAESLPNVQSNFSDLFQAISSEGGQAMERGLAKGLSVVLGTLTNLGDSFMMIFRSTSEALEPILILLGQVGSAITSVVAAASSLASVVLDVAAAAFNGLGAVVLPLMQGFIKTLESIAKLIEVIAKTASAPFRLLSIFFRNSTSGTNKEIDGFFDTLFKGLDRYDKWLKEQNKRSLEPLILVAQRGIENDGRRLGLSRQEIDRRKAEVRASMLAELGEGDDYDLKPLNLKPSSQRVFDEINQRLGSSQSSRNLEYAKQASRIKEEMYRNEIKALQQGAELLQKQKQLVESINQLSEARRSLTMQSFNLATQVAASPEAKAAAESKRDDLALQQEQQRIREKVSLLATEKQMMAAQLEIQTRQLKIDQEQLKIKRMEQEIDVGKLREAIADAAEKAARTPVGSEARKAASTQMNRYLRELQYRQRILDALDRSVSLSFEQETVAQKIFGIDMQRLDTQEQILGVQAEAANYTREQQRLLAQIQAEELRIKNTLDEKVQVQTKLQDASKQEIQRIQDQLEGQAALEKIEKARADLGATRAKAATEEAERVLSAARGLDQARQGGSTRELIEAQIRAAAAGVNATETATSAAERLYEAKERQMLQEQEVQQRAQRIQQEREQSEQRIAELRLRVELAAAETQLLQLEAAKQSLMLQGQRDDLSRSVAGNATVPGLGQGGGLQELLKFVYSGEGGYTSVNRGKAGDTPGGAPGLTGMTIGQVKQQQAAGKFFAVGAAQFIPSTLPVAQRDAGLSDRDLFSPGNQDQMAIALMLGSKRPALAAYLKGSSNNLDAAHRDLALEWASVPGPNGRGMYDGDSAGNRASGSAARVRAALQAARASYRPSGAGGPDMPPAPVLPPPGGNAMGLQVGQAVPFGAPPAPVLPGPGGAVPIGVVPFNGADSLENQLNSNTDQMKLTRDSIERIKELLELITGPRADQLATKQSLETENLSESQAAQRRAFQYDRAVERERNRILETPQGRLAASTADSVGNAVRVGIGGAANTLIAGGDPREALKQAVQGLASEVLQSTLKALLDPLISQLQAAIFRAITGFDSATVQHQLAGTNLNTAAAALMSAAGANFSGQPLQGAGLINDLFGGAAGSLATGLTGAIDYSGAFTSALTASPTLGFGLPGLLPGLASGGDMEAGKAYQVGEFGPETVVASSDATVLPTMMSVPGAKAGRSGPGRTLADGRRVSPGSPADTGLPSVPYRRSSGGGLSPGSPSSAPGRSGSTSPAELEVPFLRGSAGEAATAAPPAGALDILTALGGSPIRVESEFTRVGDLDVVTTSQHQRGMQAASDQAYYRVVEGMMTNPQLRKLLGF